MKFHLNSNIVEGTPEELVKYQELLEDKEREAEDLFRFGHAHQPDEDTLKSLVGSLVKVADSYTESTEISTEEAETASTDIQVGDRVKVLNSECGAVGEATVTKVLENGDVELEGKSRSGKYLTNWANHVSNIEKIEEDAPMGYTFWYIDGTQGRNLNVLKATLDGNFEDSTGTRYTYQAVHGLVKPLDREDVREKFEKAENYECLLKYYPTVDVFAWK